MKISLAVSLKFILSLLLITVSPSVFSQCGGHTPNYKPLLNLKGKIKEIIETKYEITYKFGEPSISSNCLAIEHRKYDDSNNQISINCRTENSPDSCIATYRFDSNGNMIEECQFRASYENNPRLTMKIDLKYNEANKVIEANGYTANGDFDFRITYKYNDRDDRIEKTTFFQDNTISSQYKYEYVYDSKGRILEKKTPNSKYDKWIYKYNEAGLLIEGIFYNYFDPAASTHNYEDKFTWKYDSYGNIIEEIKYFSDKSIEYKYTFQYEYDQQGNWVQKIMSINDKQVNASKRIIIY